MQEPVAIIGIACRFPAANNPQEFWRLLKEGREAIREVPPERWDAQAFYDPDPERPGKTTSRWGGFLDQIDQFDWRAFRISPREARSMDPQHRLLLELAWEGLEDAGIPLQEVAGSGTSVSIGIGWSDYFALQSREWSLLNGYTATGNASCFAANRLSYVFDLRGASLSLDTGCSSSLSALHLAYQSLCTHQADLALAGGVHLMLSPAGAIMSSKAGLLSHNGHCKTLDAHADGFVNGEGAGILVLKRLSDVQSSDRVYALLNGVAVNHNGHNRWIMSTSGSAQETLLHDAYHQAGIDPAEVDYVELHGTGFLEGDAIEAQALGAVVGAAPGRTSSCLIGSVKTNIGHLANAAGMAGVIKVALALHHKEIPQTLHVDTVNPAIHPQDLHLDIAQKTRPWPAKETARVAAVSTISLSGANAHAVLSVGSDEERSPESTHEQHRAHLLPLSAHSGIALHQHAASYRDFLKSELAHNLSWGDICYSAAVRRSHYAHRLALVGTTMEQIAASLDAFLSDPLQAQNICYGAPEKHKNNLLVFLFAHQYKLREAYHLLKEKPFRTTIDHCHRIIERSTSSSVWQEISSATSDTIMSPLATFVLQIAQAAQWRSWGLAADVAIGEGWGEIAAAYTAGTITLTNAIEMILWAQQQTNSTGFIRSDTETTTKMTATMDLYIADMHITAGQTLAPSHWQTFITTGPTTTNLPDQLIGRLSDRAPTICIEFGEHPSLERRYGRVISTLPLLTAGEVEREKTLEALALLYSHGYPLLWSACYDQTYHCVSLPTFPWQREKLWLEGIHIQDPPAIQSSQSAIVTGEDTREHHLSTEETLTALWSEVLGVEEIDAHSNFFQLGGHSLLATQLLARIRATTGAELSLNILLDAPTPALCATSITEHEAATNERKESNALPVIRDDREHRYRPFPATDIQQAYWAGRNIALRSSHFGNHGYIEVSAKGLDIERFNLALRRLIQRHEMLRAILLADGQQQILASVPPFEATIVDLRGWDEWETQNMLQQLRQEMDHQLLPVEQWPAFDIRIVLLAGEQAQIHLSVESLFIDAWSMHLLVQEFIQYYYDPTHVFPALKLSFRDYVLAERSLRDTPLYKQAQDYWNERITSLPPAPDLPLRQDADNEQSPRFVHYEGALDKISWSRLKTRAARANITPSGVLLAAFADVLTTWSKRPRFSINLSIFNRLPLHPQIHDIVGDFTSLIVLAVDSTTADTFEQRALHVQEQLWRDLDHSAYNGVQVLRDLARGQQDMLKAVMPIVFSSLLIGDMANQQTPPWQHTLYALSQTPQVWLDHQVLEANGQLIFHWQVIESLFPDGLISAMFSAYHQLLKRLTLNESAWQETGRSLLPLEQLTARAHANATDEPLEDVLLHQLFERQVRQREAQPAVITAQRTLSYAEVHYGAIRLAHHLRQMGARPNQLIGVVMEKGWEQVIAVLGVLYAGAAYLPIDASLPTERLRLLLMDGQVAIALTQNHLDISIDWPENIQSICIDTSYLQQTDITIDAPVQQADDLAYVIYTSGSTGRPKGVMIDHRGAVNTILDINQRFDVKSHDRVFALSALHFDLSVYDIFGTLAAGATIVMPPQTSLRDPATWLAMLLEHQVTIWNSVPALLQMLVDYSEFTPDALRSSHLQLALLSGDWIPLPLPAQIKARVPAIQVISLGGATEASIWSIFHPIESIDPRWKSIPYGRPLRNQRFFILNEQNASCPIWVPGLLYIGGSGLARGYWHDEEKTRASFVRHPQTGERLYRTGDWGRYLPDGEIEFLGREDFQVKIRGHRIELGEIEATVLQHPDVLSTVVTTVATTTERETGDEKQLVAYVVLNSHNSRSAAAQEHRNVSEPRELAVASLTKTTHASPDGSQFHYHIADGTSLHASPHGDLHFGLSSTRAYEHKEVLPLLHPHDRVDGYAKRMSHRIFRKDPIPFDHFSAFMHTLASVEIDGLPKYCYPSAGAIYPVQVYLAIKSGRIEGVREGIYYYHPHMHQLVLICDHEHLHRNMHANVNQSIFDESAFSLFFVGDVSTISPTYGDAARDFCLLEAGYMGQLLMMEATSYNLGLCPIGDMAFEAMRPLLGLRDDHIFLHSMLGGFVEPADTHGWSFASAVARDGQQATPRPIIAPSEEHPTLAIRRFLQQKLPGYMLPSSIMVLDSLPLTANGKVDRQHLPPPSLPQSTPTQSTQGASTKLASLETTIAQIWQELLPDCKIGPEDNFFEAGADSLLIVRLYTRLQKLYQINTPIDTFFQNQTIHTLAKALQPTSNMSRVHAGHETTA